MMPNGVIGALVPLDRMQPKGVSVEEARSSSQAAWPRRRAARATTGSWMARSGGSAWRDVSRILLENDVARFFADAEAVCSYESTHEISSLIVGRAVTGQSAFV